MMKKILLFLLFTCFSLSFAQNVGEYQTRPTGVTWPQNWTSTDAWQVYQSDGQWHDTTNYPGQIEGNYKVTIGTGAEINTDISAVTIGNLYVEGTLNVTQNFSIETFGIGTPPFLYVNNGTVNLTSHITFSLPAGSNVFIDIAPNSTTQGFHQIGGCDGSTRIKIGLETFSACNGNGQGEGTFTTINSAAADGRAVANANPQSFCAGASSVILTGSKIGTKEAASDIKWELWGKPNGVGVFSETSSTLPFSKIVPAEFFTAAGDYVFKFSFKVKNKEVYDLVTISVNGPTFTTSPEPTTTYCQNDEASRLFVDALGVGTLTYQWYLNTVNNNTGGTAISGATAASYTPPTNAAETLYYYVVVTAGCGVARSSTAEVIVNPSTATVTTQPVSNSYCQNATASALTVAGTNVNGYQWYSNTTNSNIGGTAISGATLASYTPPTTTVGTVYYYAMLQGSCGAVPSNSVAITVNPDMSVTAASSAPTLCINTPLSPAITHTTTGATGIGTPIGLPAGMNATWSGNTINISGTPTASGTFNYSIPLTGGCGTAVNATGIITVTAVVSAGTISGTSPLFIGDVTIYSSNGAAGGTWSSSDTNVFTVDATTGVVTAVGVESATITYTVAGCGGTASATATVLVTDVTTWNGTPTGGSWDHGVPNVNKKAAIAGYYQTSKGGDFTAKELIVKTGGSLLIEANNAVTVVNALTNNGTLVVKNNGNLLQVNDVANTGAIEVQKVFTFSAGRKQFNYVSSPTIDTNLKSIYTGALNTGLIAQYHNENTNTFGNSSGAYIAGRALALKEPVSGDAGSTATNPAKFVGVPFNGNLNYPLAYTTNRAGVNHGFNLVGNPYPSNLDLVALYNYASNKTKIESTIRFWDNRGNTLTSQQGSGYNGESYAKFNVEDNTSLPAPSAVAGNFAERLPSRYVSVGQGFMVRALSTANGQTLDFSNANDMRVTNSTVQFFGRNNPESMDRYWLGITTPNEIMYSAAVVYYEGGLETVGSDDTKAGSSSDNIFTMSGEDKIGIHGRPVFNNQEVLPLGYRAYQAGNYTISLQNTEGVFANGQTIYLKDKQTGIITNLSEGSYNFAAEAGEQTGRFEIIYQPEIVLATDGATKSNLEVYRDGTDFVINSSEKVIETIELYDASGRLILSLKGNSKEIRFSATKLAEGMYLVKTQLKDGQELTKKIRK